jgi:hypothetical protein
MRLPVAIGMSPAALRRHDRRAADVDLADRHSTRVSNNPPTT